MLKKLSKTRNSFNFDTKNARPSFSTFGIKMIFNHLQPALTKAPIFGYFDPKYYIWILNNVFGIVINGVLSKLTFKTNFNKIITKTNLD